MPIGNYNFDAQSHQQLYDKIHGGTAGREAQATDDAWNTFRAVMANAKSNVESALRDAGAEWVGAAGEAFTGAMAPLVQWAEDARVAGVQTHQSLQAQQSSYSYTRNTMPEPVKVSSTANDDYLGIPAGFTHLVGGQTDQDVEEQKANDAKRKAVVVMQGYQGGASSAVSSLGTFSPPPQVTMEVAQPKVEQSEAQKQYSQQFSNRYGSNTAADQQGWTPPPQQQSSVVMPPAAVSTDTGGTDLSSSAAPAQARPTPAPYPSPVASNPAATPPPPNPIVGTTPFTANRPFGSGGGSNRTGTGGSGQRDPRGFGMRTGGGSQGQVPGQQPGRGPSAGVGVPGEPQSGTRPGAAGTGARGAAGAPGMGMAGAGAQRGQGDEDKEHKSADYLEEVQDIWGDNDTLVAPPVIGDDNR
jgi:hypothetical protein